jgi:hypothetical protein
MHNEDIFSNVESEREFGYLSPEDFNDLKLPEFLPRYEGKGSTSSNDIHDNDKLEFLNNIGIEIPEEWSSDYRNRAFFVSAFIVAGVILATERGRRRVVDSPEKFREAVLDRNNQLEDARLDKFNYRRDLGGILVEEDFYALGFSANSQKRLSKEELKMVVDYVLEQLKKD